MARRERARDTRRETRIDQGRKAMNDRVGAAPPARRINVRATPKGRQPEPQALAEVRQLLGDAPRRRDLLIEHLHRIQDRYGSLADRHLVALAHEMRLAMTEVYEVATFYHHFDVVKEGETAPPRVTVRVCDSSCDGRREALPEAQVRRRARAPRALHRPP
jgi:formate dehydrogenase